MSDNIPPFEIQAEILKRVPVAKSLLQFRSVSKAWKCLIDSPRFVADYHPQPPRHHIFVCYYDHIRRHFVSFIDNDNDNDSCFAQHQVPLTIPISEPFINFKIYGSSQGLFCLFRNRNSRPKGTAVLWNPSIRKCVSIDVPNVSYEHVIGFWVSPYSSDPKLVNIQRVVDPLDDLKPRLVELYSLSTREWRTLSSQDLPRSSVVFSDVSHVAIGNFIFWHAKDRKYENGGMHTEREMIMVFDMISEKFMDIYLPDNAATNGSPYNELSLFKIRESLAVVVSSFSFSVKKRVIYVWMMEGGVSDSFTKMYTIITPDDAYFSLLAFRNNGHPIIRMDDFKGSAELLVYGPDSEHFTSTSASLSSFNSTSYAGSYMETLLLLDQ